MPTFTNLDLEESATVTARVGTVQMARGSTNEEQEIICLGDPDSSNALAAVTNVAPASTRWALSVARIWYAWRPHGRGPRFLEDS